MNMKIKILKKRIDTKMKHKMKKLVMYVEQPVIVYILYERAEATVMYTYDLIFEFGFLI